MSDSDWRDPFEDQVAQERAARRAERVARRKAQETETRASLSERVKEELATERESQPPTSERPALAPTPEPPPETSEQASLPAPAEPAQPPPPKHPESSRRRATSAAIARRRTGALIGVVALIALLAGAGFLISRAKDDGGAEIPAAKPRKEISVVVPEGLDRNGVADVAKEAGLTGDYLKATETSKAFNLKKLGAADAESLEGFLFPATYDIFKGSKVNALVTRQFEAFEQNFAEIDTKFAESKGLTPYDVVIIASMIEREIALPEERDLAASVIYNRLDANNPLGIDATIRFEDQNFNKPLVESRLREDTPYNTRTNAGLPPGPIGNPGLASLEAAANPADSEFFFYVIKPGTCNEHAFVETQDEFDAAAAEYQAALQAEGGSPEDC